MTQILARYSNLTQRLITALVGAAVIIAGTALSEWAYFAIFLFICVSSIWEFYKLAGMEGLVPLKTLGTLAAIAIFTLSFLIEQGIVPHQYYFLVFPLISLVYMIKLYKKTEQKPFTNIAYTFLGIFYIAVPFALLNHAVFRYDSLADGTLIKSYKPEIIIGSLLILWASDTGAYFAGTLFGKRKLFERISPKKSWEGFWGGALLALTMTYGLSRFFHTLSLVDWIIVGILIIIGGTFGDLVESLLKRSIEIKDSGKSLPGHGGFLDRFDGLFISAPFIVAYLEVF